MPDLTWNAHSFPDCKLHVAVAAPRALGAPWITLAQMIPGWKLMSRPVVRPQQGKSWNAHTIQALSPCPRIFICSTVRHGSEGLVYSQLQPTTEGCLLGRNGGSRSCLLGGEQMHEEWIRETIQHHVPPWTLGHFWSGEDIPGIGGQEVQECHVQINDYLHGLETIPFFVAGSRITDLVLHLETEEKLSKLFFGMDRINDKRDRFLVHRRHVWHEIQPPQLMEETGSWKRICHQERDPVYIRRCRACVRTSEQSCWWRLTLG